MTPAERSSLFEVQHWIVTRASGLEGGFLIDSVDRLMTVNFALDGQGAQLLQLRWRLSSDVVRLSPTESGFVVSSVVPDADDLSATSAPRGVDARRSDVFGLLDPGTEIVIDIEGMHASVVLQQTDGQEVSLELTAWNVPFASRDALIVHDLCGFHSIDPEHDGGLQQAAFARDGDTHKVIFTRFKDGWREFYEIAWNITGFDVLGDLEFTETSSDLPDPPPTPADFSDSPIDAGDSFAAVLGEDHTLELRNTTKGWDYRLTPM